MHRKKDRIIALPVHVELPSQSLFLQSVNSYDLVIEIGICIFKTIRMETIPINDKVRFKEDITFRIQ